ncbi:class I SAM-dependent methyltransferase [Pinibacter soli]|uniref:Class I SAM-dependent methyltransferase n=1 Tax=Pinibacter soli TaxID=3044211 RepID=A0ABT6RDA7_9BACT|nr:class I SAM-dependent methyltransferase [Pinibacter soli]MDI3320555.1 class I SAM-dependent methyltransferase [Pinibacter soli]
MNEMIQHNEQLAAAAFSKQSAVFDAIYSANTIVQYKRERVRDAVMRYVPQGSHILELNCGTGEDAIFFARNGYAVHATDISKGMLDKAAAKVGQQGLEDKITFEQCSYTGLQSLKESKQYDAVFSNFGGLNCTNELNKVLSSLNTILKPGGVACMVILPKFCLLETLLIFKGKFKTAFRRFFSSKGRTARIEGEFFTCWYYNPSYVKRLLKDNFTVETVEGLCTFVPPSYIEHFAEKYPRMFAFLRKAEQRFKSTWPCRSIGDYYIIVLRRK